VTEQGIVDKISTWPWRPATVGLLGTALFSPLLLTVVNLVLQRIFNP
jgi:hypothetical protein